MGEKSPKRASLRSQDRVLGKLEGRGQRRKIKEKGSQGVWREAKGKLNFVALSRVDLIMIFRLI